MMARMEEDLASWCNKRELRREGLGWKGDGGERKGNTHQLLWMGYELGCLLITLSISFTIPLEPKSLLNL